LKLSFGAGPVETDEGDLPPPGGSAGAASAQPGEGPKRRGRPPGSRNRTTSKESLESLGARLREKISEDLIAPMSIASPLAAENIEKRLDRNMKAALRIAAKNPAVRRGLEKALDGSDYFSLAMFFGSTAVCALVDFGFFHPRSVPARAAGVPALWVEVYEEEAPEKVSNTVRGGIRRGLYADVAPESE
jgi:hypothetical protein